MADLCFILKYMCHRGSDRMVVGIIDIKYLFNCCLSPLMLRVRIPLRPDVLDTTLCDKVCHWLAAVRWFFQGTPVSSTNKTYLHDITELLLKVSLSTITLTPWPWNTCEDTVASCLFPFYYEGVELMRVGFSRYIDPGSVNLWRAHSIRHFQQYFSYMVVVSFIGVGNWRKPPAGHKSLTNFIT